MKGQRMVGPRRHSSLSFLPKDSLFVPMTAGAYKTDRGPLYTRERRAFLPKSRAITGRQGKEGGTSGVQNGAFHYRFWS